MKLAGTSDAGWVPIDLTDVAAAIATVRASAVAERLRSRQADARKRKRSEVPSR